MVKFHLATGILIFSILFLIGFKRRIVFTIKLREALEAYNR